MFRDGNSIMKVEHLPSIISALVAGGVTLAVIYEFVFYYTLGLSFRNYLEIPDIIRTGLLIVPFYPIFLTASFLAGLIDAKISVSKAQTKTTSNISSTEGKNRLKKLVVTILVFVILYYLLVGGSFMLFFSSVIALFYIQAIVRIRYYATFFGLSNTVMHICIIISLSVISTLFSAVTDGNSLRNTDRNNLPIVETSEGFPINSELRLFRKLSVGLLVDTSEGLFVLVPNAYVVFVSSNSRELKWGGFTPWLRFWE